MERSKVSALFSTRALVMLIWPLLVEQLLAMTVGMADTVMLTSAGEAAVSGVSLVDTLNNLIIQLLAALCTGGAVVVAQYLGRQEAPNARQAARQLIYVATALSLGLSLVALALRRPLLRLVFGAIDADVMAYAETYLILTALSFPFLAIYNACAALFRSMGNSKYSMFASFLMNVINIGGNAILIYGCGWDVAGAGTATLVSRACSAALMLYLIRNHRNPIYLTDLRHVRFRMDMIRPILRVGIPNGLENSMFQVGKLAVQGLAATLGTAALAANAIVASISGVMLVAGSAIGLAMVTVVGQCVGAGEYDQAKRYTGKLMVFIYAALFICNLPILLLSVPIMGLFHLGPESTQIAVSLLPLLAILDTVLWPTSFSFPNALRAAGDSRFTMTVSVISMWICRVGLSYVFVQWFNLGLAGIWYAMYCDWLARSIFFVARFLSGKWQEKRVIV